MAQIKLTILVQEAWRGQFPDVVEGCRRVGLEVENELISIGVITGCIDEQFLPALTRVEGVSTVEPQRSVRKLGRE